jgi:hypothetical protein
MATTSIWVPGRDRTAKMEYRPSVARPSSEFVHPFCPVVSSCDPVFSLSNAKVPKNRMFTNVTMPGRVPVHPSRIQDYGEDIVCPDISS